MSFGKVCAKTAQRSGLTVPIIHKYVAATLEMTRGSVALALGPRERAATLRPDNKSNSSFLRDDEHRLLAVVLRLLKMLSFILIQNRQ